MSGAGLLLVLRPSAVARVLDGVAVLLVRASTAGQLTKFGRLTSGG